MRRSIDLGARRFVADRRGVLAVTSSTFGSTVVGASLASIAAVASDEPSGSSAGSSGSLEARSARASSLIDDTSASRDAGTITGTGPVVGTEVDVLVELAERGQLGDHVGGGEAGPLERLDETLAAVDQLVDLLAGEVAATGQLAERPLAVGAGLVDHLLALLLGRLELGLGDHLGVLAAAARLQLGVLAEPLRLLACVAQQALGGLLGLGPDGRRALPRRLEDARRLLAEQPGDRLVVELGG